MFTVRETGHGELFMSCKMMPMMTGHVEYEWGIEGALKWTSWRSELDPPVHPDKCLWGVNAPSAALCSLGTAELTANMAVQSPQVIPHDSLCSLYPATDTVGINICRTGDFSLKHQSENKYPLHSFCNLHQTSKWKLPERAVLKYCSVQRILMSRLDFCCSLLESGWG